MDRNESNLLAGDFLWKNPFSLSLFSLSLVLKRRKKKGQKRWEKSFNQVLDKVCKVTLCSSSSNNILIIQKWKSLSSLSLFLSSSYYQKISRIFRIFSLSIYSQIRLNQILSLLSLSFSLKRRRRVHSKGIDLFLSSNSRKEG